MQSPLPNARYRPIPENISGNVDWLFKLCKFHRLFFFLQAAAKLTASYSEILQIEP